MTRWTLATLAVACGVMAGCTLQDRDRVDESAATSDQPSHIVSDEARPDASRSPDAVTPRDSADALIGRNLDGGQIDVLAVQRPLAVWMWAPW